MTTRSLLVKFQVTWCDRDTGKSYNPSFTYKMKPYTVIDTGVINCRCSKCGKIIYRCTGCAIRSFVQFIDTSLNPKETRVSIQMLNDCLDKCARYIYQRWMEYMKAELIHLSGILETLQTLEDKEKVELE